MRAMRVDGNVLGGMLAGVFAEPTTVAVTCGACGTTVMMGEVVVEIDDDCAIVLCRSCTRTLFTVLQRPGAMRLVVGCAGAFSAER